MKFQKITDNILYCGLNDENRAIFDELIPFIRKKKTVRQIIIVTHNANVVLGASCIIQI